MVCDWVFVDFIFDEFGEVLEDDFECCSFICDWFILFEVVWSVVCDENLCSILFVLF